jgi:hypothetical protein
MRRHGQMTVSALGRMKILVIDRVKTLTAN